MTTLLDLAAAVHRSPDDAALRAVFGDRLRDDGRDDLAWALEGRCPACGGELRQVRSAAGPLDGWHCWDCSAEDHDYPALGHVLPDAAAFVRRVVRELGFERCPSQRHWRFSHARKANYWAIADDCPACDGRGLVAKRSSPATFG